MGRSAQICTIVFCVFKMSPYFCYRLNNETFFKTKNFLFNFWLVLYNDAIQLCDRT